MSSHIIDIENCEVGSYTKVRKHLNTTLGGPEAWDYDKPYFTIDASETDFLSIKDALALIKGISFLANHHAVTEIETADDAAVETEAVSTATVSTVTEDTILDEATEEVEITLTQAQLDSPYTFIDGRWHLK